MKTQHAVCLMVGVLIPFAMAPQVLAVEDGAAEGTVTVNGKAMTLEFAHAVAETSLVGRAEMVPQSPINSSVLPAVEHRVNHCHSDGHDVS